MLSGIRISNGVTRDENPGGPPVYVHSVLRAGYSDFSTFFYSIIQTTEYDWAFLNAGEFWQVPYDWYDGLPESGQEPPGTKAYNLLNTGFRLRKPLVRGTTRDYAGIYMADYMREFAPFVRDDWSELIAVSPSCNAHDKILEYFLRPDQFDAAQAQTMIVENAEWYFRNFDGLYWYFFTKHPADIRTVKNELQVYRSVEIEGVPNFDIRDMKLEYMEKPTITVEQAQEIQQIGEALQKGVLNIIKEIVEKHGETERE